MNKLSAVSAFDRGRGEHSTGPGSCVHPCHSPARPKGDRAGGVLAERLVRYPLRGPADAEEAGRSSTMRRSDA